MFDKRSIPWVSVGAATILCALMAMAAPLGAELADPMRPGSHETRPAVSGPHWVLQSTLVSDSRRLAVVNGDIVRVGDRIAGARVLSIQFGEIWLERRGRRFRLGLTPTEVKKVTP